MKKSLQLGLIFIALSVASGSMIVSSAQQRPPIVGGYKKIATNAPEVVSAAQFAVTEVSRKSGNGVKLISIEAAESQLVQGMNYRLCLQTEIEDTTNNVVVTQGIQVTVYRDLKKKYSLTRWEEADCSENE
jgi:Aspartic acid proteinase inhibitor